MRGFVLDASFTLNMALHDERAPDYAALADEIAIHGAIVPSLWLMEVANAFAMSVRRKRITHEQRAESIADLEALGLEIDTASGRLAFSTLSDLADTHALTVYDAAYLELAKRKGRNLVSLDRDLRAAAVREGVPVLPA